MLSIIVNFGHSQEWATNPIFQFEAYPTQKVASIVPITEYVGNYPNPGYIRDSPNAWSGQAAYYPPEKIDQFFLPGLLERSKLGFGQRGNRKKRSDKDVKPRTFVPSSKLIKKTFQQLLEMPLFCWKFMVNCRIFPRHICCPIMPSKKKKKNKTKKTKGNQSNIRAR